MLGLGSILYVTLLLTNAIAVLSEDRFLARIGFSAKPVQQQPATNMYQNPYDAQNQGGPDISVKSQVVNLIGAVRTLMRFPLIFINIAIILYELVLG